MFQSLCPYRPSGHGRYSTCGVKYLCSQLNLEPWCQNMPWYFQASDYFKKCNATCCYTDNCNDESTFHVWVLDAAPTLTIKVLSVAACQLVAFRVI